MKGYNERKDEEEDVSS